FTRDPARASALATLGADVVRGDLRDAASVRTAMQGVRAVVSASHSILGRGANASRIIDDEGQRTLIAAAKNAGVTHFVYTSALGASADHPVDFWRTKARIETVVRDSGMPFTILQPSAFMEVHAYDLIGKNVQFGKRVPLFGPADNPRNFVAASDVAEVARLALTDARFIGQTVTIGGPQNLTSREVAEVFERVCGREAAILSVPLALVRGMAKVLTPLHEGVGRILSATIVAETTDQTFDRRTSPLTASLPAMTLEAWARATVKS
ncbi:MAG TPA: NmrA family NAD(P)-binding protein, partial [Gemmatimonadaceae bacterium]|nr:NmrA family NAD(P)-binding protein [Gemmatimonadaceae bacterium]